jgi:hypothetical protein
MENVFVSRPTYVDAEYRAGLQNFLRLLETQGLKARTLGSGDYPVDCPLDEVIALLGACRGAIILGYPQISIATGKIKDKRIPEEAMSLLLATEWNHIEAALAYSMKRPLLVIHHIGVSRGIFDRGATNKFVHEIDLADPSWALGEVTAGALLAWKEKALALPPLNGYPEKQVDSEYLRAIHLEELLAEDGYRLYLGDPRELARNLDIEGYERILWPDCDGKKWLLAAGSSGQVPLKTRLSPEWRAGPRR